jgi:hypothetical protein
MAQAAAAEFGIGTPAAISSAIGRLSAAGLYGKPHESLPNQERWVAENISCDCQTYARNCLMQLARPYGGLDCSWSALCW